MTVLSQQFPGAPRILKNLQTAFFDIDGTLLDTHGLGRVAFAATLREVAGTDRGLENISFAGNSDANVLGEFARLHNLDRNRLRADMVARLHNHLEPLLMMRPPTLVPGAIPFLRMLKDAGVHLGLLTGNTPECARVKLEAANIPGDLFTFGGYGDRHPDRADIARDAVEAALRAHPESTVAPTTALVFGDTPQDVAAAHAIGLFCIGIAGPTGIRHHNPGDLLAAGALLAADDYYQLRFSLDR